MTKAAGPVPRRLRVAIVLETSPTSRFWEPVFAALPERGITPALVTVRDGSGLAEVLGSRGVTTTSLGAENAHDYLRAAARLRRWARREHIDVVHAHEPISATVAGLAGARARWATVYHRHHVTIERPTNWLSRFAGALADVEFTVSAAASAAAQAERLVTAPDTLVVHNGIADFRDVDAHELRALRGRLGLRESDAVVLHVSRLRVDRGVEHLFRAADMLQSQLDRRMMVVVVGSGPDGARLERLARDTGVPVVFAAHQDDVAPWYRLADVVAVPSLREGFGLSAVEAMCARRPVVASCVGGLPEVVRHATDGLLVPPADARALGDALVAVLMDRDEATRLGENGRRRYEERFTTRAMVDRWASGYGAVLRRQPQLANGRVNQNMPQA